MKLKLPYIQYLLLAIGLMLSSYGCDFSKDWSDPSTGAPTIDGNKGDTLTVLREYSYNEHKSLKNFSIPVIKWKNNLIFSSYNVSEGYEKIISINLDNFVKQWEWDEFEYENVGERTFYIYRWLPKVIGENKLIFNTNKAIYLIDMDYGVTDHLLYRATQKNEDISVINVEESGNELVVTVKVKHDFRTYLCHLSGSCSLIDSLAYIEPFYTVIGTPNVVEEENSIWAYTPKQLYQRQGGDSLLYDTVWIEKKELVSSKVKWNYGEARYGSGHLNISKFAPIYLDDKIIFLLSSKMICLDNSNGELLWTYEYGVATGALVKPVIKDSKIYFGDGLGQITCLEINSGHTIWKLTELSKIGGGVLDLIYYDGKLFAVDLVSLTVIDAETGKGIGKYASPNAKYYRDAQINAITIDEEREVMYVDDGYSMLECEIPGLN